MAQRVAQALDERETLVVEAGTGVGKTYAYLVPLLLSGQRALVSTATKSLQDQLFLRDLPRLREALGLPLRMALLKGRGSYLCRWRAQQVQADPPPQLTSDRFAMRALQRVLAWMPATRSGDLAEVEGLDERSPVIPLVSSTRDNCLGTECPEHRNCHVMHARREAMAADLVVVNHHLFFADLALRDSGVAELLPTVDAAVFDEAHQLVDAGVQFLGTTLSTAQVVELARDLHAQGLQHARGLQDWHALQAGLEQAARSLRAACARGAGLRGEVRGVIKLAWEQVAGTEEEPAAQDPRAGAAQPGLLAAEAAPALDETLQQLSDAARAAAQALGLVAEAAPDLARLQQRALQLAALAPRFAEPVPLAHVRWVDLSAQQARLVQSPLDIREMLAEQRALAPRAWVFTSATLGDDEALSWFCASTGLEDAVRLRVGSPFDYAANARLWVPQACPKPNDAAHPAAVGRIAARCAVALGGRSFVLTTTLRALPLVAQALGDEAQRLGRPLTLLVQGSEPRRSLLQRFRDGRGAVLIGSASFWEGIDVPGDALQCVLIDKLPFPPPNDPLVQARVRQIRERGGEPFDEYFLAEAAIALKQGAGRLIRTETDRGLLVICDPRMRQMGYGRRLRAALPPMAWAAEESEAMAWLAELGRSHL